ncbi:MAG: pyrroline-5-carboxylate reductase [Bdellovibrionia bacterium]
MRVGIIGLGQMGEAIARGLQQSKQSPAFQVLASTRTEEKAKLGSQALGISCSTQNAWVVDQAQVVLLCVKPHQAQKVLKEVAFSLNSDQLLISIAASVTTEQLTAWSQNRVPVIRAMPNTPCLVGQGMTVLCAGARVLSSHLDRAREIFGFLGRTAVVDESLMDAATGLSGCGPAYVYLIIEALSEAGVKLGLPRELSTVLAAQTLAGASEMALQRNVHPASLKDEVTTPAGCTIDGLMALEEGKLRVTLIKAVLAASDRSRKLRQQVTAPAEPIS